MMIELIFVVFGLVLFVNQLFTKWNVWEWIQKAGSKSRFLFIYKLTSCRFCLLFHLTWIMTTFYVAVTFLFYDDFCDLDPMIIFIPFVVSGLISKTLKNDI